MKKQIHTAAKTGKRFLAGLLSVLLTLTLISAMALPAVAATAAPYAQNQPKTMVILGDSIAAGYSAPTGQGYGPLVANDWNMTLINRAVGGWRTEHVINQLQTDEVTRDAIRNADVIQIAICGNDLQQAGYIGPAIDAVVRGDLSVWNQHCDTIAARFAQIVDLVRALNPRAPFFVFNSYSPDYKRLGSTPVNLGGTEVVTGTMLYAIAQDYAIPRFNSTYVAYLEKHPGAFTLVDIYDAFPNNETIYFGAGVDVIHPSAAGHAKLAERLNAAIDAYNSANMVVTPVATVEKLKGNQNQLTIAVKESFPLTPSRMEMTSFMINNNAAGYYPVGKYTVYVDTKGNTQVRDIFVLR